MMPVEEEVNGSVPNDTCTLDAMISRNRKLLLAALLTLAMPTSAVAQSEDTSGADQYTEQGIPGAETPSEPAEPAPAPAPEPEPAPSAPSGSTSQVPTDTAATTTQAETTALPRTGAEELWIALTALTLLGCGYLLRRVVPHQSA